MKFHQLIEIWAESEPRVLDFQLASLNHSVFEKYPHFDQFQEWLSKGYHGSMTFLEDHLRVRQNIRNLEEASKSVLMILFAYPVALEAYEPEFAGASNPKISAYAQGKDYHHEMREAFLRLKELCEPHKAVLGVEADFLFRSFSDSAPVFERDLASLLGLGWLGKNACLINKKWGSGFFIGGVVTNIEVPLGSSKEAVGKSELRKTLDSVETGGAEEVEFSNFGSKIPWSLAQDFCGGCTRCIDACPTDAIESPGVIKANQCISYWTIEHKGKLSPQEKIQMKDWVFGCDICQQVCPWNFKSIQKPTESQSQQKANLDWPTTVEQWLELLRQGGGFKSTMKETPLYRAGRRKLLRNLFAFANNQDRRDLLEMLREISNEESGEDWAQELEEILAT